MISRYERANLLQNFLPGNVFVFLRYKGNYGTRNAPEKFREFEKRAPGTSNRQTRELIGSQYLVRVLGAISAPFRTNSRVRGRL